MEPVLSNQIIYAILDMESGDTLGPVLITSFPPWRKDQRSNSSDDLVAMLQASGQMPADAVWLRWVPVDFELAPKQVIGEMRRLRPRAVICCGMAEGRSRLSIERQAIERQVVSQEQATPAATLQTSVDIPELLTNTTLSERSDDAGRYVCNHLYYRVLSFIKDANLSTTGVFLHIPILSQENKMLILGDFTKIVLSISKES